MDGYIDHVMIERILINVHRRPYLVGIWVHSV